MPKGICVYSLVARRVDHLLEIRRRLLLLLHGRQVTHHLVLTRQLSVLRLQGGQGWAHRLLLGAHLALQQTLVLVLGCLRGHGAGRAHLGAIVGHDRGSRSLQRGCRELLLLLLQLGSGHRQLLLLLLLLLRLVGRPRLLLLLLGSECVQLGASLGGRLGDVALDDLWGKNTRN